MKNKVFVFVITLIVMTAFIPTSTLAASKVKMTAYDRVIKTGNTVYCAGEGPTIYKVKLKKGKVKSAKHLVRVPGEGYIDGGVESFIGAMKKKGNYLYYIEGTNGTACYLKRVHVTTGRTDLLVNDGVAYAIKGKKLYARIIKFYYDEEMDEELEKTFDKVLNLNGANKKKSSKRPLMKTKKTNAGGYSVKYKEDGDYLKTYLKTPKGTFYLGKSMM